MKTFTSHFGSLKQVASHLPVMWPMLMGRPSPFKSYMFSFSVTPRERLLQSRCWLFNKWYASWLKSCAASFFSTIAQYTAICLCSLPCSDVNPMSSWTEFCLIVNSLWECFVSVNQRILFEMKVLWLSVLHASFSGSSQAVIIAFFCLANAGNALVSGMPIPAGLWSPNVFCKYCRNTKPVRTLQ